MAVRPVSSLGKTARSRGVPPTQAHQRDRNPSSGASSGALRPPRSGCATHAWGIYFHLCPFLLLLLFLTDSQKLLMY